MNLPVNPVKAKIVATEVLRVFKALSGVIFGGFSSHTPLTKLLWKINYDQSENFLFIFYKYVFYLS